MDMYSWNQMKRRQQDNGKMTIQQLHSNNNNNNNDNNSPSILLKINNNSITMVMRRLYRRLFGTADVRRRVSMVMVLTGLCVFTLVFRVMLPQTILTAGVKMRSDNTLWDRTRWSARRPLEEKNYTNKINVVEEHHEVLQYWLQDSSLPKTGNVLVHIDGHEDGSLPEYQPNFPFFSRPENMHQLRVLMQENDVFILGAVMSGLISRVIFIWPSWDHASHSHVYESSHVGVGWYIPDPKEVDKPKELCFCNIMDIDLTKNGVECSSAYRDESNQTNSEDLPTPLNVSQCKLEVRFRLEILRDDMALTQLSRGVWLVPHDNIILDIDEDFFGCEAAVTRFKQVGLKWTTLQDLSELVDQLFCVRTVTMEQLSDRFLSDVIKLVLDGRTSTRQETMDKVLDLFHDMASTEKKLVCHLTVDGDRHTSKSQDKLMTQVVEAFLAMNAEQLKLLLKVGFCLSFSPVTYIDESPSSMPHFQVCYGSTGPENHFITHHIPTPLEVEQQTLKLQKILSLIPKPKHVTVCRSFRDGYVPKDFFPQIERNVLKSVHQAFPSYQTVNYDPLLLGGRNGWFAREYSNYER